MLNFTYDNHTRTIFGKGTEMQTGAQIAPYGKKVLLHYGGGSIKRSGLYDKIVTSLKEAGLPFVELGGVKPNPVLSLAKRGIAICKSEGVDFILAVGGGSVIDSAKTIAMGALYDGDVWDFYCGRPYQGSLPIGAVLTIPAAGSESSADAVLTKEEGLLKRASCSSPRLRPVFAIMNPEITMTLPPYQTFAGVSDIMAHILERYFTTTPHVDVSDRLCEGLLKAVMSAANVLLNDPGNYDARAEIMWAGSLAHNNLCGVDRNQEWSCHGMGHEISALYDATHGATLAMLFPKWMAYRLHENLSRAMQFAGRVFDVDYDPENPEQMAMEGVRRFAHFLRRIGMPASFADMGIANPAIAQMANKCTHSGGHKLGAFKPLACEDVINIYRSCL